MRKSLVGWDGVARGLFAFDERWRPGATSVIRWLVDAGYDVAVITGDHAARGRAIRKALGVPVAAALLPADKAAFGDSSSAGDPGSPMIADGHRPLIASCGSRRFASA